MVIVDDATAASIRAAYEESGELAGVVELRRHLPLLTDNMHTGRCVRMIAGWRPTSEFLPSSKRTKRTTKPAGERSST